MTKYYTVTGKSTERPASLPAGFEVEETEETFDRVIGCGDDGYYDARLRDGGDNDVQIQLRADGEVISSLYFLRDRVVEFRDALTEFLGDGPKAGAPAVVSLGDPEPPRTARYVEQDGDIWRYDFGGWGYRDSGNRRSWTDVVSDFPESFPMTLQAD